MSAVPSPVREALRIVTHGGRLTRDRSREAFGAILDGPVAEPLVAGLLGALAALGESPEEVAGVVDRLLERATPPPGAEARAALAIAVCGTGGDGRGTFNVSTATALVGAGAGVPVAKHGGRAVSSACGSADVLAALGVDVEMDPACAAEALRRAGVTFLFAPAYHRAMRLVAPLRRELGVRTIFNLAGPLANPLGVRRQLVGVDRPSRIDVVARALRLRGPERAGVVSNERGGDELLPFGETLVAEVRGDEIRSFTLTPADFGVPEGDPEYLGGGDAIRNAEILRRLLDGEEGTVRDTVLMNAAAALVVAGRVTDPKDGVRLAHASIDSGEARRALLSLAAVSKAGRCGT